MYRFLPCLLVSLLTQMCLFAQPSQPDKQPIIHFDGSDGSCQSVQSGDWDNPATWSCNHPPTAKDLVVLNPNHIITISAQAAQANRIIDNGGTLQFSEPGVKLFLQNSSTPIANPVIYRIRAGQQNCDQNTLLFISKTTLSFSATFDNSAVYTSQLPENQHDINKLYGFSDCDTHHNIASARFGWNWRDNALRIYAYCYRNGQRVSQELGVALLNTAYDYQISIVDNNYVFTFNGQQTVIARGCTIAQSTQRYLLYPYFGGDEVAPHDITISITEK